MPDVLPGQILVADHQGIYVIKMVGDVRLTLCVSFDQYIQTLFQNNDLCTIVFDLSAVQGLDSTTLGFIAKVAIKSQTIKHIQPVIISDNQDILRLLSSIGIDSVCQIIGTLAENYCCSKEFSNLALCDDEERLVREKVLEAHRVLMSLNELNRKTFKDLVKTLEEGI
ncbi:anti-anti-sigma factor [Candidatus Endobugula sertula]|uniref:Anti-anti-sigma factor n=1 Tax=Candidatus Endobugula sertula TaxID=62101 RepID=A0A1D2QS84_9GAMM|nr:anti-anti-sigma factor [Candidatus Endobugula sertula]